VSCFISKTNLTILAEKTVILNLPFETFFIVFILPLIIAALLLTISLKKRKEGKI